MNELPHCFNASLTWESNDKRVVKWLICVISPSTNFVHNLCHSMIKTDVLVSEFGVLNEPQPYRLVETYLGRIFPE